MCYFYSRTPLPQEIDTSGEKDRTKASLSGQ